MTSQPQPLCAFANSNPNTLPAAPNASFGLGPSALGAKPLFMNLGAPQINVVPMYPPTHTYRPMTQQGAAPINTTVLNTARRQAPAPPKRRKSPQQQAQATIKPGTNESQAMQAELARLNQQVASDEPRNSEKDHENRPDEPQDEQAIRNGWKTGDLVEVFSSSADDWFIGNISEITHDSDGEWLVVKYTMKDGTPKVKEVAREDSEMIRPAAEVNQGANNNNNSSANTSRPTSPKDDNTNAWSKATSKGRKKGRKGKKKGKKQFGSNLRPQSTMNSRKAAAH